MKVIIALIPVGCIALIGIGIYLGGVGRYKDPQLGNAYGCGKLEMQRARIIQQGFEPLPEREQCVTYRKIWEAQ